MSTAQTSQDRGPAAIRAYYNEIDPFAADWIRALMAHGLIASGDVDTRSITDVRPSDLRGYTQCHFFAGIGGWSYALRQAGWDDTRPVWTGSCPCQPFSAAGKQKGFDDERHLWPVWRELIRECAPAVVFGEQVANATEWLGLVHGDLEAMEYAVAALPIQAASAGAYHLRDRYWFVAHAAGAGSFSSAHAGLHCGEESTGPRNGQPQRCGGAFDVADAISERGRGGNAEQNAADADTPSQGCDVANGEGISDARQRLRKKPGRINHSDAERSDRSSELSWVVGADGKARPVKPGLRLLAHGVSGRVGKLRGFGNAIDPRPAAAFIGAFIDAVRTPALSSNQDGTGGAA